MDPLAIDQALFGRVKTSWLPERLQGLIRFGWLVAREFGRNRCLEKSASLAFETLLHFVPVVVLSLFLVRSFGGLDHVGKDIPRYVLHQLKVDEIHMAIPAPAGAKTPAATQHLRLSDKIQEVVESADQALRSSSINFASLLVFIVTAILLALTFEHALNDIWSAHGQRGILLRVAIAWTAMTLVPLLIAGSVFLARGMAAPPGILDFLVSAVGPLSLLWLLYRCVPAAAVTNAAALTGSIVASVCWSAAKNLFVYYVSYAMALDKLYGTLGLLPIFFVWLWIGWIIVLIGAEVSYTYQHLLKLTAIERRRLIAPFVLPGPTALDLVVRAAKAYRSKQPMSAAELAETSGLPDHLWRRLVDALLEKKILLEDAAARHLVPGRPLDSIRIEEVFAVADDLLIARPGDAEPAAASVEALSLRLAGARRRELANATVEDLLA